MSLIDIPNDIYYEISKLLDLPALVALSRTCRALRTTTEYGRFREIKIQDRSKHGTGTDSFNAICKAHALFNAFRKTPSLRRHVERVEITATFSNRSFSQEQKREVNRMEKENSKNFQLTESDELDLQVDIALFGLYLNISMMGAILDLPRLRELELRLNAGNYVHTEASWLNARRCRCPSLQSLKLKESWISHEMALWLFTMAPNVHEISFDLVSTSVETYRYPPESWENDKKWLQWGEIGDYLRDCLARDPPLLKSLELRGYCVINLDGTGPFQGHAESVDEDGEEPSWGIDGELHSLQQFSGLESLAVSAEVLLGPVNTKHTPLAQLLPASIKKLSFPCDYVDLVGSWDYPEITTMILEYLGSDMSVNLSHLSLDFGWMSDSDNKFVMSILKICEERAIELELREYNRIVEKDWHVGLGSRLL